MAEKSIPSQYKEVISIYLEFMSFKSLNVEMISFYIKVLSFLALFFLYITIRLKKKIVTICCVVFACLLIGIVIFFSTYFPPVGSLFDTSFISEIEVITASKSVKIVDSEEIKLIKKYFEGKYGHDHDLNVTKATVKDDVLIKLQGVDKMVTFVVPEEKYDFGLYVLERRGYYVATNIGTPNLMNYLKERYGIERPRN